MKRTAFTYFERYDPIRKRRVKSRYRVPQDELPEGTEAVGEPEWRDIPEPGDEPASGQWTSPSGALSAE
jgi:hypothetical protein